MMLWSYFGVQIKGADEKREGKSEAILLIETVERGGKIGRDKRGIISKFHKLDSNTHLLHELSTVICWNMCTNHCAML